MLSLLFQDQQNRLLHPLHQQPTQPLMEMNSMMKQQGKSRTSVSADDNSSLIYEDHVGGVNNHPVRFLPYYLDMLSHDLDEVRLLLVSFERRGLEYIQGHMSRLKVANMPRTEKRCRLQTI